MKDGGAVKSSHQQSTFIDNLIQDNVASSDGGGLEQILRVADALITIVERDRDVRNGKALPTDLRAELETKLGVDFGDVRVRLYRFTSPDAMKWVKGDDGTPQHVTFDMTDAAKA